MPNAVEAGREHVEQHAPDELGRGQRHGLLAGRPSPAVVGVAEAHGVVVEAAQTLAASDNGPFRSRARGAPWGRVGRARAASAPFFSSMPAVAVILLRRGAAAEEQVATTAVWILCAPAVGQRRAAG